MKKLMCVVAAAVLASGCSAGSGYGVIVAPSAPASVSLPPTSAPALREVPTETHTGKGEGQFAVTWPADQLGFFTFDCPKCAGNVIISTDGGEFSLVNAIGAYKGTTWLNTEPDRPTTKVTVLADAPWTATIADYRSLPEAAAAKPSTGKGDAVLRVPAGITRVHLSAKTRGNIALWVKSDETDDLLVNQIGNIEEDQEAHGPAYLRVDGYEANWTLTPS
jgi:hypothetical protein